MFVTPRNWKGKNDWAAEKNARGEWKAVRAYDASDLEQWLEESVAAQIWLAEKLRLPITGFETLGHCLDRWTTGSDPPMPREIFEPSITAHRSAFVSWLERRPKGRSPLPPTPAMKRSRFWRICSTTRISANGVIAWPFSSPLSRCATLAPSTSPFIPIATTLDAERELGGIYRRYHSIVVRPRNAVDSEPDIALDLLGTKRSRRRSPRWASLAIELIGWRESRASHRPILRRRLSEVDAIKTPVWARDAAAAKSMIPMALIGAWNAKPDGGDREVLAAVARREYQEIEEDVARLRQLDDPPVWSEGLYRGVASKIDSLFAVTRWVTQSDLADFFTVAEYVLSEEDPALDLPEEQRWAAGIYGKLRDHSGALREGICETLVILSVHGNKLFHDNGSTSKRALQGSFGGCSRR